MALTVKRIEKLKKPGRYGDGHGLYLQVVSKTNRSWLLRFERSGRERWAGLGPLHTFNLEEARERARKARQQLADGIDPIEHRKANRAQKATDVALAAAKDVTFADAAEQYFKFHSPKWRNLKHARQFLSTLKQYAYPVMGALPVGVIDKTIVLKAISPIWLEKNETANRVRNRIEAVLDFAKVNGWREGDNPAAWAGNLEHALPSPGKIGEAKHHAALAYSALPDFLAQLRQREGVAARALEFTILTAARTGEVIGATWAEINFAEKIWVVPANRIKGGREHRVPLSARALEILSALPRETGNPFIFIGPRNGGLSGMAMAHVLARMGRRDITVHGFRSSFRIWAAERTSYASEIAEQALAHQVDSATVRSYKRTDMFDKRRRLMQQWSDYCGSKPVEAAAASVVVTMRR